MQKGKEMSVEKISTKDGDVLFLECPSHLTKRTRKNLTEALERAIGKDTGVKVVILEDGIRPVVWNRNTDIS